MPTPFDRLISMSVRIQAYSSNLTGAKDNLSEACRRLAYARANVEALGSDMSTEAETAIKEGMQQILELARHIYDLCDKH